MPDPKQQFAIVMGDLGEMMREMMKAEITEYQLWQIECLYIHVLGVLGDDLPTRNQFLGGDA